MANVGKIGPALARFDLFDLVERDGVTLYGRGKSRSGPCPECGDRGHSATAGRVDRFSVWVDAKAQKFRWSCRKCGTGGDAIDYLKWHHKLSEMDAIREITEGNSIKPASAVPCIEDYVSGSSTQAAAPPDQATVERYKTALRYNSIALQWLLEDKGIDAQDAEAYGLGYCMDHTMTFQRDDGTSFVKHYGESIAIPIVVDGKLANIRHRIIHPKNPKDRYVPHVPHLGIQLYGVDGLKGARKAVIVEGEFKRIVVTPYVQVQEMDTAVVAIFGVQNFSLGWLDRFKGLECVYVALDPGINALELSWVNRLAVVAETRMMVLPRKPDDLVRQGAAGAEALWRAMTMSTPVHVQKGV